MEIATALNIVPGASAIRLMPATAEGRGMAAILPDLGGVSVLSDLSERTLLFSRFLPPMRMMAPKVLYLDTFIFWLSPIPGWAWL